MYVSSPAAQHSPAQPLHHNQQISGYGHTYASPSPQQLQLQQKQQQQQLHQYYAPANQVDTTSSAQIAYASEQHQQQQGYSHAAGVEIINWAPNAEVGVETSATTTVIDLSMIGPILTILQEEVQKLHIKMDLLLDNKGSSAGGAIGQLTPSNDKFKKIETIEELNAFNDILKSDPESTAKLVSNVHYCVLVVV